MSVSNSVGYPALPAAPPKDKTPPAPPKDTTPPAPPKTEEPPVATKPKRPKTRTIEKDLFITLKRQADLAELDKLPVGDERRQQAVQRMRQIADDEQNALIPMLQGAIEQQLADAGLSKAKVKIEATDRLWVTNAMKLGLRVTGVPAMGGLMGGKAAAADAEAAAAPQTVDLPFSLEDALKGVAGVSAVMPSEALRFDGPMTDAKKEQLSEEEAKKREGDPNWNLKLIGADVAWKKGYRGQGVTVANVDTGVKVDEPALWAQYRGHDTAKGYDHEKNSFDPYLPARKTGQKEEMPIDDTGHGTHTMGTMVGNNHVDQPIGVAPDAQFIQARGLTKEGGDAISLLKAMQWTLAPTDNWGQADAAAGAQIVNHSWGSAGGAKFDFTQALRNLKHAGQINVVAAGNDGRSSADQNLGDPGLWLDAITVGAIDRHKDVADFSSKGPSPVTEEFKPYVVAPGVKVPSSLPGGGMEAWSGTSMATPHVTGALAVIDSALAERGETPMDLDDAKFVLRNMTKDVGAKGPDHHSGYGMIDLTKVDDAIDALIAQRHPGKVSRPSKAKKPAGTPRS